MYVRIQEGGGKQRKVWKANQHGRSIWTISAVTLLNPYSYFCPWESVDSCLRASERFYWLFNETLHWSSLLFILSCCLHFLLFLGRCPFTSYDLDKCGCLLCTGVFHTTLLFFCSPVGWGKSGEPSRKLTSLWTRNIYKNTFWDYIYMHMHTHT